MDEAHRYADARVRAELSVEELWFRYLALGGTVGLLELEGFLHGLMPLERLELDMLAHALNERLAELYNASRVPYGWDAAAPTGPPEVPADLEGDRSPAAPAARPAERAAVPVGARGPDGPAKWTPAPGPPDAGAPGGETPVDTFLRAGALVPPHGVAGLLAEQAAALEVQDAVAYLVDLQQTVLTPLPAPGQHGLPPLPVDATPAGRSFRRLEVTQEAAAGGTRVWLPLLDGSDRLGVLGVTVEDPEDLRRDGARLEVELRRFAALAGELVLSKTHYGDTLVRARRRRRLAPAEDMQWSLLPPLTFADPRLTVAGALEPGAEVAGDCVDYAVDAGRVHLAVVNGVGQGLRGAQVTALAVAAYRGARRAGLSLTELVHAVDAAVCAAFPDAGLTAVLAELDTDTGMLSWVNAGHPAPLLLRHRLPDKLLHVTPTAPLGLTGPARGAAPRPVVGGERLEPGDRILLHTDGVTEVRSPDGHAFGARRLTRLVTTDLAAGLPASEVMRRLVRSLLEHRRGPLDDDAAALLLEWRGRG